MATIGRLEKTHVFNKIVVCAECYKDLQSDLARSSRSSASGSTTFQSMPTKGDKIRRANEQLKVFRVLRMVLNPLCVILVFAMLIFSKGDQRWRGTDSVLAFACIWLIVSAILYSTLKRRSKSK
jgi:hypothetical protein